MCDDENWIEYHVDYMPDDLRGDLNGGIGGYVSQRRLCVSLRPNAPRTDEELLPLLCDLLVVSSVQLHDRLRRDLDSLVIGTVVGKEFFNNNRSLGIFFGKVSKRFDDTNIYRVDYNDGDREDYNIDELLPILQIDDDRIDRIRIAHVNLVNVLFKAKISKEDDKYFFRDQLLKKTVDNPEWFGATLEERRKLSVSLFNFCVFKHPVGRCRCDLGVDPWARSTPTKPCVFRHSPDICKCDQIAIKFSQDECSYAAYILSKREWRVGGKHKLRKKQDGPPLMVSDYASFEFALGIKVTADQLTEINRLRADGPTYYSETDVNGKSVKKTSLKYYPEADSITVHVIQPGENADGWWSIDKILHQAEDVVDVLRVVAPPRIFQYIPYYDNSATHNKRGDMTLATGRLNAKWGGKQLGLRDSKIIDGCVGNHEATMWYIPGLGKDGGPKWVSEGTPGSIAREFTLKVGDTDYGQFQMDDPPPFYDLDAEKSDRPMTVTEKAAELKR